MSFFKKKEEDPYKKWFEKENLWKKAFLAPLPVLVLAIFVVLCAITWHYFNPKMVGSVKQTHMEIRRYTREKESILSRGDKLYLDDEIELKEQAKLKFDLKKTGGEITADEGTELKLFNYDKILLKKGRVWVKVYEELTIELPEGSLQGADADFMLETDDRSSTVSVTRGFARFNINDKEVNVSAGNISVAYTGRHPSDPTLGPIVDLSWVEFVEPLGSAEINPALLFEGSVLTGKLITEEDRPVKGSIFLISTASAAVAKQTESDARGRYIIDSIDPGDYRVSVRAEGFRLISNEPITFPRKHSKITRDFVLERGNSIRGRITDVYGRPVEEFYMKPEHTGGLKDFGGIIWTEPDGSFSISDLAPGEYDISIYSEGYAAKMIKNIPVNSEKIKIVLLPAGKISGRVLKAPDSAPMRRFSMRITRFIPAEDTPMIYDDGWKDFESQNGTFILDNLNPGTYTLCVINPGLTPVIVSDIPVEAARITTNIQFLLPAGGSIKGTVLEKGTEQPVAKATVAVYQYDRTELNRFGNQSDHAVLSSEDGSFRIEAVPAGNIRLIISHPDFIEKKTGFEPVISGRESVIKVYLERGSRISGRILDPIGNPLQGHHITLLDSSNNGIVNFTDEQGRYQFNNLAAGRYQIKVGTVQSFIGQLVRTEELGSKDHVVRDFQYQRGVNVAGKVMDSDGGVVLAGLLLKSTGENTEEQFRKSTISSPSGEYAFISVPPGTYSCEVTALSGSASQKFNLEALPDQNLHKNFVLSGGDQ